MKLLLPALAMLAVMGVAVTAPMAHAVTFYTISATVVVDGHSSTGTFRVVDVNNDGAVTLAVGSGLLSQINGAFGTTTFAFPGSYTGTFTINGSTVTLTLSSTDTFTLQFTQAPPGGPP